MKIDAATLKGLAILVLGAGMPQAGSGRDEQQLERAKQPALAIENVRIVDVAKGEVANPSTVLVAGGNIVGIGPSDSLQIPVTARRIDGEGRYLIPGLVDMHVHLFNNATHRSPNEWTFPLFIASGVTSVREMAATPADMVTLAGWREAAAKGDLIAPHVLAAGVSVRGDSAADEVRQARAAGADFIKVFSEIGQTRWRAIMNEARTLGIPVCGHVPADVRLLDSAAAGQRSSEHLMQVYEACSSGERGFLAARAKLSGEELTQLRDAQERDVLESFDQGTCDQAAAALAKTQQLQVPTLVLPYFEAHRDLGYRKDPRWRFLRADEQARWERTLSQPASDSAPLPTKRWEVSRAIVKALSSAGVRMLAGTDTPMPLNYPGSSLHTELELLVESGLSPADALRAATLWPAEFCGAERTSGSIAAGKRADLVLLNGDPLADIKNTRQINAVVLAGQFLPRAELHTLTESVTNDKAPIGDLTRNGFACWAD